ncbi:MAG: OsmC family protein [Thermocrispum sp.]
MSPNTQRSVSIRRTAAGSYVATNRRGGELAFGTGGESTDFTPVELLLTAIAGCTAIDVDTVTARRSEPASFELSARGDKIRDDDGNRMENLEVVFRVRFPDGADGDAARELLPGMVAKSHDRICTVSRTVELGTPVRAVVE